jgi:hypothetical protein
MFDISKNLIRIQPHYGSDSSGLPNGKRKTQKPNQRRSPLWRIIPVGLNIIASTGL